MGKLFYFLIKYIFRTLHMGSFGIIFGNFIYDYLFGKRIAGVSDDLKKPLNGVHVASCIVLIISGIVNMVLLYIENRFVKNGAYEFWKKAIITKLAFTLSLTPILDVVIPDKETAFKIRVGGVLGLFLVSPFLRYYREYYLSPQKANEELLGKSKD
jgi:hypothetical protein